MGYLGIIKLGANLTFYANTHTPATGAAVDADAVPGYRVYEDETDPPILTGVMAKLDDDDTTGFYSEKIAVTTGNGFEAGKSYTIRITGVVGGVTGVELHQFDVSAALLDDIEAQTDDIGVAGAGLTALGDARLANLDATISSRSTLAAGASMALTAAAVDAIWDELTAGHAIAGSTGKALSDAGAAGDPWAAAVRTLTSSAAATAATVAGSSITITRGDTASISITGLGSLALRTKLWFTVKNKHSDADTASVLQVEETGGLLYLNGAATTITNATLVVDDEAAGNITVTIKAAATAALSPSTYSYDVQQLTSDPAVHTETAGTFTVSADYTRAVA